MISVATISVAVITSASTTIVGRISMRPPWYPSAMKYPWLEEFISSRRIGLLTSHWCDDSTLVTRLQRISLQWSETGNGVNRKCRIFSIRRKCLGIECQLCHKIRHGGRGMKGFICLWNNMGLGWLHCCALVLLVDLGIIQHRGFFGFHHTNFHCGLPVACQLYFWREIESRDRSYLLLYIWITEFGDGVFLHGRIDKGEDRSDVVRDWMLRAIRSFKVVK